MKRIRLLKIVNGVLFFTLLNQVITAVFGGYIGTEAFEVVHVAGGIMTALLGAAHVALNSGWVKANFSG
ncbi:MAG TPA: hypothetical protein VGJ94_08340 [Syntrophorhabdaceae bacterium]|jgi:hypothetical protein